MEIIESWQDHNTHCYATVKHPSDEQRHSGVKEFEAMWLDNLLHITDSAFINDDESGLHQDYKRF